MRVVIYGASDDLIEIEGDISEEIDCYGRSPKLYIYSEERLEFCVKTSFKNGFWEVYPILDEKTFDGGKDNLKSSSWNLDITIQGHEKHNQNSMVLTINSGDDRFEISKRRRK